MFRRVVTRLSIVRMNEKRGFTLIEVLLSLIIALLVLGGVMEMLSGTLHYRKKVNERKEQWPVLDLAAQKLLSNPELLLKSYISLSELPGDPKVRLKWKAQPLTENDLQAPFGYALYHVTLTYGKAHLEVSFIANIQRTSQE